MKALEYEKTGYSWNQEESLEQLIQPDRIKQIKEEYIKRQERMFNIKSPYLMDILDDEEEVGCASCFI